MTRNELAPPHFPPPKVSYEDANKLGAQEGEVEHLELRASVKVLELLLFWLRNLGAHPLSLEHLEVPLST